MENQNNTFNDFNELDDLRQQINDLKHKVDQQGRLNEDLVKKAIQGKMKGVHSILWKLAIVAVAVIPLFIAIKYQAGISWPLTIATILMMVASITSDYFINRIDVSHMGDDLVATAGKLVQMKKNRKLGQRIGIAVTACWFVWFAYEYYMANLAHLGPDVAWAAIIPLVFGALIGGLIGTRIFNKMQRANDEMIDQINEFTREQ